MRPAIPARAENCIFLLSSRRGDALKLGVRSVRVGKLYLIRRSASAQTREIPYNAESVSGAGAHDVQTRETLPHPIQESDVITYLCKRLAWAFLVLLGITAVVFVVVHLSGDPAALYMSPEGTKEDYQILRAALVRSPAARAVRALPLARRPG
jgi:hypothetical protein